MHKHFKLCRFFPSDINLCTVNYVEVIKLKLFFVNIVSLITTKIVFACFNKTGKINRKLVCCFVLMLHISASKLLSLFCN